MFPITRSIAIVSTFVAALGTSPAHAQTVEQAGAPTAPTFSSCEKNPTVPGAFRPCALTLKYRKLSRDGTVIGKESLLHPIGLAGFVAGDSATEYARSYERNTTWAMRLGIAGLAVALSPFIANHLHACQTPGCPRPSASRTRVAVISGISLFGISIPLQVHGHHQGLKAISFYNASLGR